MLLGFEIGKTVLEAQKMGFNFIAGYLALWFLVVFQGLLAFALLHRLAELRETQGSRPQPSQDSLLVNSRAPAFEGLDARTSQHVSSQDLLGQPVAILFLSGCEVCVQLANDLRDVSVGELPPIVAFGLGGLSASSIIIKKLAPQIHVLLKDADETAARYRIPSVPAVVVVDKNGIIRAQGQPRRLTDMMQLVPQDIRHAVAGQVTKEVSTVMAR
jgi:AhpC/TSA family